MIDNTLKMVVTPYFYVSKPNLVGSRNRYDRPEVKKPISFLPLYEIFHLAGLIYSNLDPTVTVMIIHILKDAMQGLFIHLIREEKKEENEASSSIRSCPPRYKLNN